MSQSNNGNPRLGDRGRAVLADNGDFIYTAEISSVPEPVGGHCLTIRSRWRSARDAEAEQVRLRVCMDDDGLQALCRLIEQVLLDASGSPDQQARQP